jgi:predicted metal-dependent HD superfamily phosphohydrolase
MTLDRHRWNRIWTAAVASPVACDPFPDLVRSYAEPHRHYHNAGHIAACLTRLDEVRGLVHDPLALELAVWWHDAVYDPRSGDNEAQSARQAVDALDRAGGAPGLAVRVANLVLVTRTHEPDGEPDAAWMIDLDLAVLGGAPDEFAAYDAGIRREYAWVEPEVYRHKRAAVLAGFLARPAIFRTSHFRDRHEIAARRNLAHALKGLRDHGGR